MAFSEKLKNEIQLYCTNHLPPDSWYENEFSFIQDIELKNRIIAEFKAIRFAYKLYEGIEASNENLVFENDTDYGIVVSTCGDACGGNRR